jgi:membrane protease subunit (stomatin/prohibitin family)
MATTHELIALSDSAATEVTYTTKQYKGTDVTVQNVDATANVFLGGVGVTASDYGYKITAGAAISFEVPREDSLYAISDVNGSEVAVLRMGLENTEGE